MKRAKGFYTLSARTLWIDTQSWAQRKQEAFLIKARVEPEVGRPDCHSKKTKADKKGEKEIALRDIPM